MCEETYVKGSNKFNAEKMYTFLKVTATCNNMTETLKALPFVREKHKNQFRKGGEPYIVHPLTMACNALSMGLDDETVAVILYHDVPEDCGTFIDELPTTNKEVKDGVRLMTFRVLPGETKDEAKLRYYTDMTNNKYATICKLVDRCNNVSTMAGVFTLEKLVAYIKETREYIIPLLRRAKEKYPEMSNMLFILKYHIVSVVDSIDAMLKMRLVKQNKYKIELDGCFGMPIESLLLENGVTPIGANYEDTTIVVESPLCIHDLSKLEKVTCIINRIEEIKGE